MDKYLEAEKRLAELLGWTAREQERPKSYLHFDPQGIARASRPEWCHDNAAAFALMVECSAFPVELKNKGQVTGYAFQHPFPINTIVSVKDHPDRDTAVRFAIVQAVIAQLEAKNG